MAQKCHAHRCPHRKSSLTSQIFFIGFIPRGQATALAVFKSFVSRLCHTDGCTVSVAARLLSSGRIPPSHSPPSPPFRRSKRFAVSAYSAAVLCDLRDLRLCFWPKSVSYSFLFNSSISLFR